MSERGVSDAGRAGALTAVEEQILAYIRAGMVDAEIAVRLGISNGDVKARVERLATKLGVEDREGLRSGVVRQYGEAAEAPTGRTGSQPRERLPGLSLAIGAALIFTAGVATGFWLGDESSPAPADSAGRATEAAISPAPTTPSATPTQVRTVAVVDGREMAWAGRLFNVRFAGAAVTAVSNRESVSVVTLAGPGFMPLSTGWTEWRVTGGNYLLSGMVAGITFDLFYQAGDEFTRFIIGPSDSVSVYSLEQGRSPVVVLYALGPGRSRHHLHVTEDGVLYIELTPIPKTLALDERTGEALDTSGMLEVGSLPVELSAWAFNICEPGPCAVSRQVPAAGENAPVGGALTCPDDKLTPRGQVLTLDAGDFRLHFSRQVGAVNGVQPGDLDCPDRSAVSAGGQLVPAGLYSISASSPIGEPLDVIVDGAGRLFVGKAERRFGCPCVSGS